MGIVSLFSAYPAMGYLRTERAFSSSLPSIAASCTADKRVSDLIRVLGDQARRNEWSVGL